MATRQDLTPPEILNNKLALIKITSELMPAGKADYLGMVKFPKISDLIVANGEGPTLLQICVLVRDFCGSLNVARNMNENQILEAGSMLLKECDNFRLEDYLTMFELAKRGELVKIYDSIDLRTITAIFDEYYTRRAAAAREARENYAGKLDGLGPVTRTMTQGKDKNDKKNIDDQFAGLGDAIAKMKEFIKPIEDKIKSSTDATTGQDGSK